MVNAGNIPDFALCINHAGVVMEESTDFYAHSFIGCCGLFFKEYMAKVIHCLFVLLDYLFILKITRKSNDTFQRGSANGYVNSSFCDGRGAHCQIRFDKQIIRRKIL
jgi:hypothetical protein